jgi:predicted outer membrane repeat protein
MDVFSQPMIANCVRGNWSLNHRTVNDHGGTTVVACTFQGNYAADHGGGLSASITT